MDGFFFILLGVLVTWFTLSALHMWWENTDNHTTEQVLEIIINAPLITVFGLVDLISFPFICVWKFFRNVFRGVTIDTFNKCNITKFWKIGNLRLCFDPKARALCNKVFLVRIVQPQTEIVHTPKLKMSDTPSVPDGDFR